MNRPWPKVRLGEVLRRSEETIELQPDAQYRQITVKLWGKGVVLRGVLTGAEIAATRQMLARRGQFILSRIDARNGALGIVPLELDGAIVTNDFPLFNVVENRLLPAYLGWMCRTASFVEECKRASEGTTNRVRLQEDKFLAREIPLPPLAEQRRVVARIEELAAQIHEARTFRRNALQETEALQASNLGVVFRTLASNAPVHPLGDLCSHILDGPHVTPAYLPDGVPGIPFVTVKNMVSGKLDLSNLNYVSQVDHRVFTRRCRAEFGDALYSKDGATRGRPCFVDTHREFSYFVSVALIKPHRHQLDGKYLVHLLNSAWIKDRMADKSRGDMIPHIVLKEIRAFPVPTPPLPEQRRIVAELDALQAEVDALKRLQAETAAALDALLPAILDHAFQGDL